jgi:hypothetical protein
MRFTVVWIQAAQDALADIWNNATDRQDVTDAADVIDRELAVDADFKGAQYGGGWVIVEDPLVAFTVDVPNRLVTVVQVARTN